MFILGSVLTNLILAVSLIMAAAVAGLMAYHYAKARLRENQGFVYDPDTDTVEPDHAGMQQRAKSAEEIAQIRSRIEALMEQQQMASETQNQHLGQKLDEIRTHMGQQDVKMDGLKSELRHEIRSRDSELGELRQQLAAALDSFWKAMPAIAEGGGDALALPPANETADEATIAESFSEPTDKYSEADSSPPVVGPQPDNEAGPTLEESVTEESTVTYGEFEATASYSSPQAELPTFEPIEPIAEEIELMQESDVPAFSSVEPETQAFSPIEHVEDVEARESAETTLPLVEPEPLAFAPIEPVQEFEVQEPEEAVFSPVEPEPAAFAPIEPVQEFELQEPEETVFSPVEPEPAAFAPIESVQEFELQEPEETVFSPVEPEPEAFAPVEPVQQFEAQEPEEATFTPVEGGFAPFTSMESVQEIDVPDPEEATFAPFKSESATFAPFEPDEATITPISQDSDPEPIADTFEPITFSSEETQMEAEMPSDSEPVAPAPPQSEVPFQAPIFEPIEFAPSWTDTDPEPDRTEPSTDAEFKAPVFAPIEPIASVYAGDTPGVEDVKTPDEPLAEEQTEDPISLAQEYSNSFTQPEAPDAEPDASEEAIWTSAAGWTEPTPYDSFTEPEEANDELHDMNEEGQPTAEDQAPTEEDSSFIQHVVVSPSGDSISVQPEADVEVEPTSPAEAPKAVLDADSLFTGDPRFDPRSPFDEIDEPPAFEMVGEAVPTIETEDEPEQLAEVAPEPAPENKPANEDRPPVAPESSSTRADAEGDDLTTISSITPEVHDQLYELGITTLDEMARWSRADARRVSSQVGVSEETIMHQWIFEAQSALFDSFQDRMARQTARQAR